MDLFDFTAEHPIKAPHEGLVLSVTDISNRLRELVEAGFANVEVEGEISSLKIAASGHVYFNLKDENNVLNAIIWRGSAQRIPFALEEGQQVVARGKLTTYGARSNYQMIVSSLKQAGIGDLMRRFEELKNKLSDEGLFDEHLKKEIPYLPSKIGIITSPTGAVIEDMKHRIEDRFPTHILLAPVLVQGQGAKEQIAAAIEGFNRLPESERPDVLIVARGGGSLEDLWAFNEEIVVRAVAASDIPVISGVGHEPDVTLCDFAADLRAPTPTAAAEMVVPVRADLQSYLFDIQKRLPQSMRAEVQNLRKHVQLLARALPDPQSQLNQARLKLDDRHERLGYAMSQQMKQLTQRLSEQSKLLESYSHKSALKRGFAYVTGENGEVVRSAKTSATEVSLHFEDGTRTASLK